MDFRYYTFRNRIIRTLVAFGRLDERVVPTADRVEPATEYRVKPLYHRFLQFRFTPNAGTGPLLLR